jgi:xanthine dehydrogenase large subunit
MKPFARHGAPITHESAATQVSGLAAYIDDLREPSGTLHAVPVLSPIAHGRLIDPGWSAALACPGVMAVLDAHDLGSDPYLATHVHDELIFPQTEVNHAGQVLGLVVAQTRAQARRAAAAVQPVIEPLPTILGTRQALAQSSFVLPTARLQRGDAAAALAQAPNTLQGQLEIGAQEHFYLETQIALACPSEEGAWHIHSSTQHPGEVQHWVAHALELPLSQIKVSCRRMGGGFGGKETQAGLLAVWAALAARKTGRPVKLRLDRLDDMRITGKRHPFSHEWQVGFDEQGRIQALDSLQMVDCGHSADLSGPVADRAMFHTDNAYWLPAVQIVSHRCKTHTQSHTAFRGFGGPQGMLLIEAIMGDVARHLQLDPLDVRLANVYGRGERDQTPYGMRVEHNILPELMQSLAEQCRYRERRAAIQRWNQTQTHLVKGIALTPVKFGISFTATQFNQAGAIASVYTDGSVRVHHGGTEMGQGLHTKITQIVAQVFGIEPHRVWISPSDTAVIPNASATAASSGTDLNGRAAQRAAMQVRENIAGCLAQADQCQATEVRFEAGQVITPKQIRSFAQAVQWAYQQRVALWSDGFYATPEIHYDRHTLQGKPFYYFAHGAACSEVVIDTRTGEHRLLATDILQDVGQSLNLAIDRGQIEGGFTQGLGWLTTEELVWNAHGVLQTTGASTYKIPTAADLPEHFHIDFWHEPNPVANVGGSKAVGEPPFMLAMSVFEALRDAIAQACSGATAIRLDAPATPERVWRCLREHARP